MDRTFSKRALLSSAQLGKTRSPPTGGPPSFSLIGAEPKPPACRCLFGRASSAERQETRRTLREIETRVTASASEKYNFDFPNETPLAGRYSWKAVDENGARSLDDNNGEKEVCQSLFRPIVSTRDELESIPTSRVVSNDVRTCSESDVPQRIGSQQADSSEMTSSSSPLASPVPTSPPSVKQSRKRVRATQRERMTDFYNVCKKPKSSERKDASD